MFCCSRGAGARRVSRWNCSSTGHAAGRFRVTRSGSEGILTSPRSSICTDCRRFSRTLATPAGPLERAVAIEALLRSEFVTRARSLPDRFVAHIQPYEFEALRFSDPSQFARELSEWARWAAERAAAQRSAASPEHIDDGPDTHPSALLERLAGYHKVRHGPAVARTHRIGPYPRRVPSLRGMARPARVPSCSGVADAGAHRVDGGGCRARLVSGARLPRCRAAPTKRPGPHALRKSYADVMSVSAVRGALHRLNYNLPEEALDDALRKLMQAGRGYAGGTQPLISTACWWDGGGRRVPGRRRRHPRRSGARSSTSMSLTPTRGTAINQFTVTENGNTRRPDIVVFVNDLPLGVIELKNPADENATVWSAFHQLQTYKAELPSLFACNAVLVVSDGMQARLGTLSAGREWYQAVADHRRPWSWHRPSYTELQVLIEGVFEQRRFLSLLRDFIVFEDDGGALVKKMAGYHQFHAVEAAVGETVRAAVLQRETRQIAETGGRYEAGRQPGEAIRGIGALASCGTRRALGRA